MKYWSKAFFISFILFIPEIVFAHAPLEGLGNFYNGLLHPVFIPAHLLLLLALGLFIGQQGFDNNRSSLAIFAIGAFGGLVLAWFSFDVEINSYLLAAALVLGILVALELNLSSRWLSLFAFSAGLLLGMDSTQETLVGKDKVAALLGTGVGLYFLQLYPIALSDYFNKKPWQKIGIRVIGSWITAISFLVLALAMSASAQAAVI